MDVERRTLVVPDLRARAEDGETTVPGLVGHAATYNNRTVIAGLFVEVIEPRFFDPALEQDQDVRMLFNHNPDLLLARTASGTLRLGTDDVGLATDADLPPTSLGNDLQVLLARKDVNQMSFAWTTAAGGDRWETLPDDDPDLPGGDIRYLQADGIDRLYDVSPVTYPAYQSTDAQLRDAISRYEEVHGARKTRATVENMLRRFAVLEAGYNRIVGGNK